MTHEVHSPSRNGTLRIIPSPTSSPKSTPRHSGERRRWVRECFFMEDSSSPVTFARLTVLVFQFVWFMCKGERKVTKCMPWYSVCCYGNSDCCYGNSIDFSGCDACIDFSVLAVTCFIRVKSTLTYSMAGLMATPRRIHLPRARILIQMKSRGIPWMMESHPRACYM